MKTFVTTALMAALLLVPGSAWSQDYPPPAIREPGSGGVTFQRHSSTFEEGALRGYGEAARGTGDFLYNLSLGAINQEIARRMNLDNRKTAIQYYFDARRMNREARAYERGPVPTQEDLERYSQMRLPNRLSRHEYEPVLGRVYWPPVLEHEYFAEERQALDELIAERALTDQRTGNTTTRQIRQLTAQLEEKLRAQIRDLSPTEFISAKRFLDSLDYEAQLPVEGPEILAQPDPRNFTR